MNIKYTVTFGDNQTESTITFISKYFHLYEVLADECGFKIVEWEGMCAKPVYVEYNDKFLPTGRFFMLISSERTMEDVSKEVKFFNK